MKKLISVYCIAYLALLAVVVVLLCAYPKLELHLMLNSVHTRLLDTFFKYYSMIAEGPIYVLALLPIFWKKIRLTLFFALSELTGGGLLQILKHSISTSRPISMFENYQGAVLPLVQGVDMHHGNSFPSGHASTFFVFSTCCALLLAYHYRQRPFRLVPKGWAVSLAMLALLILAALGAYSRVYLSQHFLSDVCVGSIIGFATPCLFFYFAGNKILKLNSNETTSHDETIAQNTTKG
jgi:membrane-associated phospholipid phosphatase